MRCVFVGTEYSGKSTLIDQLTAYYRQRSLRVHGDDHFTIPDATLSPESRAAYVHYPNDVRNGCSVCSFSIMSRCCATTTT